MDLFNILLLKALSKAGSGGTIGDEQVQQIVKELETKVSQEEMEEYISEQLANLPSLSDEEILNILK